MGRRLTQCAKVVRGWHDPASKKMQPHAIDYDAREKRISGGGDTPRQLEPATSLRVARLLRTAQRLEKPAWHQFSRRLVIAANKHVLVHARALNHANGTSALRNRVFSLSH